MKLLRRALLIVLALALAACASLRRPPAPATAASAPAAAAMIQLEIDAPRELRPLLESHLDLARLHALAGAEPVSETEIARLVAAAPAQARALLETEGYFDPVVQVRREGGDPPRVRVQVIPGPRVRVGHVTFEVEGPLERAAAAGDAPARTTLAALREAWPLKAGQPFVNLRWTQAKNAALAQLRAEGYAGATWSGTGAEIDAVSDEARLFLVADSGPRFHVGELVIEGLHYQDEAAVRNLAGFARGDAITDKLLLDFQERLQTSGLFDRASVVLDPDPDHAAAARITVQVHEMSLQQATAGVGYSTDAGPRASLEHWHRRLFGQPLTARNKIEWGRDRKALDGEISTHAKHDFWRNLVGYSVEKLITSADEVQSVRARVGRGQDLQQVQRLYFVEAESDKHTAAGVVDWQHAVSANYHWSWRELDSLVLPTNGFSLSLQAGLGQASDSSQRRGAFARLYGRATLYKPLGQRWFGNARLELGQISTANEVEVPDTMRFRAGGDESVRGYAYRSLAPTVNGVLAGGKVLFTSSIEVAHPISEKLPNLWWAVFVDAGRAADRFSSLRPAYGAGGGVRWRSPVGPLKIDLAYGNETRAVRLHFSVGVAF